ncbi:MAG: serine/threonine protein kinase [Betaproteobacteria bacterium]
MGSIGQMTANEPGLPYAALTPDVVLNSVDAVGLRTTGTLLALNSYENRVFQLGVEADDERPAHVVAKFYRPARWTDAQILEEHDFVAALADVEVPAVPPLTLSGRTLHHTDGYRFSVFPRQGGRVPNLDDDDVLEWIGRFIGRIHAVGGTAAYKLRPALDPETFGRAPRAVLLDGDWLPPELRVVYGGVSQQALDGVQRAFERAGDVRTLRLHGDVHEGNVLWTDGAARTGPHFVDFDDSRMGPAVQDFWMLLGRERDEQEKRLTALVAGYEDFAQFNRRELHLVEALRTLRLIHYSAWIASRWTDPAFPAAFPWFGTQRYWEERILELREQIAAMHEAPLIA